MQVFYKYRILIIITAVLGQAFLFSLGLTAWRNIMHEESTEADRHNSGVEIIIDKTNLEYAGDTTFSGRVNLREAVPVIPESIQHFGNSNFSNKQNIRILF